MNMSLKICMKMLGDWKYGLEDTKEYKSLSDEERKFIDFLMYSMKLDKYHNIMR